MLLDLNLANSYQLLEQNSQCPLMGFVDFIREFTCIEAC